MTQIFGNSLAQSKLKIALENQARSLCLVGPAHVGKATFLRDILSNLASDTDLLITEKGIESAREAVEFCKAQPLAAPNRYVMVDDAHLLTEAAQDAYLKLLEEPGLHSCIAFVVPDEGLLQPAIQSRFRCVIRWQPLSPVEMRGFAESFGSSDNLALTICGGKPGLFHHMFEDEGGTKHAELFEILVRAFDGKSSLFLDSTPTVIKEMKEPLQRECVSHVCRAAALTALRDHASSFDRVSSLLRYSSLLISMTAANAEIHWLRMTTHLASLV